MTSTTVEQQTKADERALKMFGMTQAELEADIERAKSFEQSDSGYAISILSDAQELLARDPVGYAERVRQTINCAKYSLIYANRLKAQAEAAKVTREIAEAEGSRVVLPGERCNCATPSVKTGVVICQACGQNLPQPAISASGSAPVDGLPLWVVLQTFRMPQDKRDTTWEFVVPAANGEVALNIIREKEGRPDWMKDAEYAVQEYGGTYVDRGPRAKAVKRQTKVRT